MNVERRDLEVRFGAAESAPVLPQVPRARKKQIPCPEHGAPGQSFFDRVYCAVFSQVARAVPKRRRRIIATMISTAASGAIIATAIFEKIRRSS
jgi:hypothetical protein